MSDDAEFQRDMERAAAKQARDELLSELGYPSRTPAERAAYYRERARRWEGLHAVRCYRCGRPELVAAEGETPPEWRTVVMTAVAPDGKDDASLLRGAHLFCKGCLDDVTMTAAEAGRRELYWQRKRQEARAQPPPDEVVRCSECAHYLRKPPPGGEARCHGCGSVLVIGGGT